jgi:hypothetical protein
MTYRSDGYGVRMRALARLSAHAPIWLLLLAIVLLLTACPGDGGGRGY